MGQKTNPKGFRLVTTQNHLSHWYANKLKYSSLVEEDFYIRSKVDVFFSELLSISKVEIDRSKQDTDNQEYVTVTIQALFPRAKEISRKVAKHFNEVNTKKLGVPTKGKNLKRFTTFLLKRSIRNFLRFFQLKTKKNYFVQIKFLKNPFQDASLIAKFIGDQLEKRTPFRRAVKQTIKKVQRSKMKGVKVEVSGRLNGIEIARSEWKRDGKIPLHTLDAKIDYTHQIASTIYGVIGIKVWLFKD